MRYIYIILSFFLLLAQPRRLLEVVVAPEKVHPSGPVTCTRIVIFRGQKVTMTSTLG